MIKKCFTCGHYIQNINLLIFIKIRKTILASLGLSLFVMLHAQKSDVVKLQVNAEKQIATAKKSLTVQILKTSITRLTAVFSANLFMEKLSRKM
jgi:hypothetical protein